MMHPTELRLILYELRGCQGRISFHCTCTTEALKYNILRPRPNHRTLLSY
jgi:hypothetical protein